MTRLKRISTPWAPEKKEYRFISAPRGAHKLSESLPLLLVIRNNLKLADSAREAKKIIKSREVLVDNKVCTDHRRGIGFFDAISLKKTNQHYRLIGKKLFEIPSSEAGEKICKIIGKHAVSNGKLQVNFHDGRSVLLEKNNYSVGDSLVLEVPEQKVSEHLKFEPGCLVIVTKGSNAGKTATVQKIERGVNRKLWLEEKNRKFEAPFDGVFVVGKEKPAISLGEKNE